MKKKSGFLNSLSETPVFFLKVFFNAIWSIRCFPFVLGEILPNLARTPGTFLLKIEMPGPHLLMEAVSSYLRDSGGVLTLTPGIPGRLEAA